MQIKIGDIEIIYSNSQKQYIDDIKRTIENNYQLLLSCLDESKTLDISDDESNFNDMFYIIINGIYNNDSIKETFNNKDYIPAIHIQALIRKKENLGTSIVEKDTEMSDELLSTLIAYKYFSVNGTFNDFVDYLKVRDREEEIFKWFHSFAKWSTYNSLLDVTSSILKQMDDNFFEQMNSLMSVWINDKLEKAYMHIKNNNEYCKITKEEFDQLFYEFLSYINAPVEWVNIYNELKEKNLIIVKEDNDISMCFRDTDGIFKILINSQENIGSFCDFVHEFIHYISNLQGLFVSNLSIIEFPSIFFEVVAAMFLKEKGYDSEIVNRVVAYRENNNFSIYIAMQTLFVDLMRYIKHGEISKNDKLALLKSQVVSLNLARKKMLELLTSLGEKIDDLSEYEELNFDIEKMVEEDCDSLIDEFIENGLMVINGYQYLLGTYLAEQVLEKNNNDGMVMQKMIDVSNNLKNIGVGDILKLFDIESVLNDKNVKKLTKRPRGEF